MKPKNQKIQICSKCLEEKEMSQRKNSKGIFFYTCNCIKCNKKMKSETTKRLAKKNPEKIKEKNKIQREKMDKAAKSNYMKKYRQDNKEILLEQRKEYLKRNPDKVKKWSKSRIENMTTIQKLSHYARTSINKAVKRNGYNKTSKTQEILGCSFYEFLDYIENKFESWMTWDNRGLYNGSLNYGWDIDHIIPLCSANSEEELHKLCHYTNLQPLDSKINRDIKNDSLTFNYPNNILFIVSS